LVPPPAAASASATASSSPVHVEHPDKGSADDGSNEGDSDYASLHDGDESESDSDLDDDYPETSEERAAREKERQAVLEAAGLIVRQDVKPPPRPARKKLDSETPSSKRRRPAPAAPQRASISSISSKDLPPIPEPEPEPVDVNRHLDDAYDRYESFKKHKASLSLHSIDLAPPVSPTASITTTSTTGPSKESDSTSRAYSQILNFLGRRTPANESESKPRLIISAPILSPPPGAGQEPARGGSPAFGTVSGESRFAVCCLVTLLSHGQVWWTIRLWRVYLLTSENGKR
jgi:actin cytoskeleton-regulatory complex protein PAN1